MAKAEHFLDGILAPLVRLHSRTDLLELFEYFAVRLVTLGVERNLAAVDRELHAGDLAMLLLKLLHEEAALLHRTLGMHLGDLKIICVQVRLADFEAKLWEDRDHAVAGHQALFVHYFDVRQCGHEVLQATVDVAHLFIAPGEVDEGLVDKPR